MNTTRLNDLYNNLWAAYNNSEKRLVLSEDEIGNIEHYMCKVKREIDRITTDNCEHHFVRDRDLDGPGDYNEGYSCTKCGKIKVL